MKKSGRGLKDGWLKNRPARNAASLDREAGDDLEHITDYLFEHVPGLAAGLVREVYDAPSALLQFPHRGRPGKIEGTRTLTSALTPIVTVLQLGCEILI
jgi:plasmid stabilization system protein ParE